MGAGVALSVLAVVAAGPLAAQDTPPVDHGPVRGFVFGGFQADLEPFRFDRAAGVGALYRVGDRWFVGARLQGEDRQGGGADFLAFGDVGRFLKGGMWGGANLAAVGGSALRNGDWFWTAGLQVGGKDSVNPFNLQLELRLVGGQGALEVWSALAAGFTFPPFSLDGRE